MMNSHNELGYDDTSIMLDDDSQCYGYESYNSSYKTLPMSDTVTNMGGGLTPGPANRGVGSNNHTPPTSSDGKKVYAI